MRIVLLASASSIHAIRWANGLVKSGHEVHLITQHAKLHPLDPKVVLHSFPFRGSPGYFLMVKSVRNLLLSLRPDLVNAHYASGYGTTARLVRYKPCLLSVWGSDVYEFPYKSPIHYYIVRQNLLAASKVASTSHCMAQQVKRLVPELGDIEITPFGVDLDEFSNITPSGKTGLKKLVIGTVKTLAPKYGISVLIRAFASLAQKLELDDSGPRYSLHLRLIGDGPQMQELKELSELLGISHRTTFVGGIPHSKVPEELAKIDIYVALSESESESFGVAIIEASAAARPVVVSNAGGLPEVTVDNVTGFVVPRNSPAEAAAAIERLVFDSNLRLRMGIAGRAHVSANYSWANCLDKMISVYTGVINGF
jgi:glycosyltransferase involved in cell wall biosynthesis